MTEELAWPDDIFDIEHLEERHNLLIYGPPGVGKSVLGGGSGLIIAVEPSGPVSAKRMGSRAKIWPAPTWERFDAAVDWLERTYARGQRPFEWITVDTANAMQQAMLRWILEEEKLKKTDRDIDKPELQDHFKWQQMFKRYILRLNDLPVNVLYLANENKFETALGKEMCIPAFDGKQNGISSWVCAQMDSVGYMHMADVLVKPQGWKEGDRLVPGQRRKIQFAPKPELYAKDRSGNVTPAWWVTNLADLHQRMAAPPKGAKPMPLAGVAERTDTPRKVASEVVGALEAGPTAAPASPPIKATTEEIEDAEVLDDDEIKE